MADDIKEIKESLGEAAKSLTLMDWAFIMVLVGIAALIFMFALNQATGYFYKVNLLTGACKLCLQQNPQYQLCPASLSIPYNITFGG